MRGPLPAPHRSAPHCLGWRHTVRSEPNRAPPRAAVEIGWHKGTMVPEATLNRILFATRYTRYLDQHGFIRFQDWHLYGERGLAHQPVTVWVYEGTLKLEYQAVTLSKYRVELQDDRRHIKGVSHPRIAETPFRSPQLTLFDLVPDECILYCKAPPSAFRQRKRSGPEVTQLTLFEMPVQEKAAGAEMLPSFLRLVAPSQPKNEV